MNQTTQIGRIGQDPELRHTQTGTAVASTTLAVDDGFGDNKKTYWFPITMWDKNAETAAKYATKGRKVGVTGKLVQESWEDKETGQKRSKVGIRVFQLDLLDAPKEGDTNAGPRTDSRRPATTQAETDARWEAEDKEEGEIPF